MSNGWTVGAVALYDAHGNPPVSPNPAGADRPDLRQLSLPGTLLLDGFILEERNPALQGRRGLDTFKAMGHDPTVALTLRSRSLPILSTEWRVDPADDSPQAAELADFVHYNLFEFGSSGEPSSFRSTLRQAVTGRDQFGFAPFEVIWRMDDDRYPGKVGIERLSWMAQWTRYKWNVEEVDMPDGGRMRRLISMTQWAPPFYQYTVVPADKMALFVREQDGENFDGVALTRAMYKPWWIRDRLYAIQSVGLERAYMGTPVATLPDEYTSEMAELARDIVQGFRTHERAGAIKPESITLEMIANKLEGPAMQAAIQHHTQQITFAGMAQFQLLGSGTTTGSYALSTDLSEMFLMSLNADCNSISDVMNFEPVIPRLIDYNFPNIGRSMMPKLTHGEIGQKDFAQQLRALAALIQWGGIVPDDGLEDHLRRILELPDREGTITPEYLSTLIPSLNPPSGARTHDVPRPPVPPGAQKAFEDYMDSKRYLAPPSPAAVAAAEARHAYIDAKARMPWPRPSARLTDAQRMQLRAAEQLAELAEIPRTGIPERPSVRMARMRKPYAIRQTAASMAETGKISDRHGGGYTLASQHLGKHKKALEHFISTLGKSKAAGHVPIQADVKVALAETPDPES